MTNDAADFIRAQTVIAAPALVPEIKLHLAGEGTPLWQISEERLKGSGLAPPFWAFAWPGGQALARYLLDHPEEVRGKRVLDIGAGSGLVALAAMKAGALFAAAVDPDPAALAAVRLNAALNNVAVEPVEEIELDRPPKYIDLIVAGDVCYEQAMAAKILRWLRLSAAKGVRVLLGDPGRAYAPQEGLKELARMTVPVARAIEEMESREVKVWEMEVGG